MQINQPKDIKQKMRQHKLRIVNWKEALMQKGIKQSLGVFNSSIMIFFSKKTGFDMSKIAIMFMKYTIP